MRKCTNSLCFRSTYDEVDYCCSRCITAHDYRLQPLLHSTRCDERYAQQQIDILHETNPCGSTPDPAECACGCSGYDDRCDYYILTYEYTDNQVSTGHTCCDIPGRGNRTL